MGFHLLDLVPILLIGLAIFGPKALQSMARNAGKGVGQAKAVKEKVMSELPMEEIAKVTEHIPQVPLNSRQAIQMLMAPSPTEKPQETKEEQQAVRPQAQVDQVHQDKTEN